MSTEIKALTDAVNGLRKDVLEQLKHHHETLYGNGKPGLDEQVRVLNSRFGAFCDIAKRIGIALAIAGITSSAGIVIALIIWAANQGFQG